jgi:hypothetical protein
MISLGRKLGQRPMEELKLHKRNLQSVGNNRLSNHDKHSNVVVTLHVRSGE